MKQHDSTANMKVSGNRACHDNNNLRKLLMFLVASSMQLGCFLVQVSRLPQYIYMISVTLFCFLFFYSVRHRIFVPRITYKILLWLALCTAIAVLVTPLKADYSPKLIRIAYEGLSAMVAVIMVILAYNITLDHSCFMFLKYFSYFTVLTILASFAASAMGYREYFYYFNVRFCGLAGNPNDYMGVIFVALPYFLISKQEKGVIKWGAIGLLLLATLLAGSKGGTVILAMYAFVYIGEQAFLLSGGRKKRIYILFFMMIVLLGVGVLFSLPYMRDKLELVANRVPSFERIFNLIYNFKDALSDNGSQRIEAWMGAVRLIQLSPVYGVGIGGSSTILETLGYLYASLTPHNIYLELLSQSGIPVFVLISVCVLNSIRKSLRLKDEGVVIVRHVLYLLLLNGIFFASNWFCLFWVMSGLYLGVVTLARHQADYEKRVVPNIGFNLLTDSGGGRNF